MLDQACAHCPIFPTAASRRSLGRVSVPVWLIVLSDQLPIAGLVGRYPANYLIGRRPLPWRRIAPALPRRAHAVLAPVSQGCPPPQGTFLRAPHPSAAGGRNPPRDLHVLSMPPAFALSQDQTLKFIAQDRAEALSCRRLSTGLRSPLSMRSAFSSPSHAPTPPLRGTARAGKGESARLLPKDGYGCQRSSPSRSTKPTKKQPCVSARQRTGARRHEDQDRSRTALNPRTPAPARPKAPPTDRLGRSNRSAAGNPTWRPVAPVSRPVGASPEGTASRRTPDLVLPIPPSSPGNLGLFGKGTTTRRSRRDGAPELAFKTR